MWRKCEHVNCRPCELDFTQDLSLIFFSIQLRRRCYFVLSALEFSEFKRCYGSIFRNLSELSFVAGKGASPGKK